MTSLQMDENSAVEAPQSGSRSTLQIVLLVVAAIYVIVSLYFIFETRSRLAALEAEHKSSIEALNKRQVTTEHNLTASTEALAQRLGMTEQELQTRMQARTAELQKQQIAAERRLEFERLMEALAALDPEFKAVIVLRDVEECDYDQVAAILEVPVGTIKSRLFRARIALRDALRLPAQRRSA